MVRFRYLLGRMKLNRILLAWKVQIRKIKVQRLQFTLANHAHYKRVLKESMAGWRQISSLQKLFREKISAVIKR